MAAVNKGQAELEVKFLSAAEQSHTDEVIRCIAAGVNPNCRHKEDGNTALHFAAQRGDVLLVLKLLRCPNIIVDPRNYGNTTPLHLACRRQNSKIVKCLLNSGADPNVRARYDRTPLHIAVYRKDIGIALILLKFGAKPNILDSMSNTPLHLAILGTRSLPLARLLIKYGANPNLDVGNLPLFLECVLACHTEDEMEVTLYLLRHGVDVNVTDKIAHRNALHYVALTGYQPLTAKLLQMGCDPFKVDHYGKTPIDIAKTHGNDDVVFMLDNYMNPSVLTDTDK